MSVLTELVQRTEQLQQQAAVLCAELAQLRKDLDRLRAEQAAGGTEPESDCLAVALSMAQELGPEFSSETPHALARRGEKWFGEK